jgi:hypothetical protein
MRPFIATMARNSYATGRKALYIKHTSKQARRKALYLMAYAIIMHKIFIFYKAAWPSIARKPLFYMAIN